MSIPFVTRAPRKEDVERLRLAVSTFTDGSGMLKEPDGSTIPGWRVWERTVAEVLGGVTTEGKGVFDVLVEEDQRSTHGLSVKSRELSSAPRVSGVTVFDHSYLEVSNASAEFWRVLESNGITEEDFRKQKHPERIGKLVVDTVNSWYS